MTIQITKASREFWITFTNADLTRRTVLTVGLRGLKIERYTRHPRTDRVRWLGKGEAA